MAEDNREGSDGTEDGDASRRPQTMRGGLGQPPFCHVLAQPHSPIPVTTGFRSIMPGWTPRDSSQFRIASFFGPTDDRSALGDEEGTDESLSQFCRVEPDPRTAAAGQGVET